jgi:hypothetical protein
MRPYLALVVGSATLLAGYQAHAHHSFAAEFDVAKPFNLTGTVTKVVWSNPHAWLYVDVTDAAKKTTSWAVELNSPNALLRASWKRDTLKQGDVVTVEGSLAKDGSPTGNARSVTTADGQKLFAGSSQFATP